DIKGIGQDGIWRAAGSCHKGPACASTLGSGVDKSPQNQRWTAQGMLKIRQFRASIRGTNSSGTVPFFRQALDGAERAMLSEGRGEMAERKAKADDNPKGEAKASRRDRLKVALRENLKRRKAQARERGKVSDASSSGRQTSLDGEVGKRGD